MNNIADFFQKFLNLEKNNQAKTSIILETIKEKTGLEIKKESLEIKGDRLKINVSPIFRNEIFMRKEEIENSLRNKNIFLSLV